MGWCSGSELAEEVWGKVKEYIPKTKQKAVAKHIVELFNDHGADCWQPGGGNGLYGTAFPNEVLALAWDVIREFKSSNGRSVHTVSQNVNDNSLKCTCQGFRIGKKGFCKHTKLVQEDL